MYADRRQFKEPALQEDWFHLDQFVDFIFPPIKGGVYSPGCRCTDVVISAHPLQCDPRSFFVQLDSVEQEKWRYSLCHCEQLIALSGPL